jgi:hypothetical protein
LERMGKIVNQFTSARQGACYPIWGMCAFTSCTNGDLVMWAFIEKLYREYCLARLQEMRKYELSH